MDNIGSELIRVIKEKGLLHYITSRNDEVSIRCIYCGDSVKSPYSAHLYIELTEPYRWYCQKCNTEGKLDTSFLRDIEVFDNDFTLKVIHSNNKSKKKYKTTQGIKLPKDIILDYNKNKLEKQKLDYINDRLDLSLNFEDAKRFKMILNLQKFFDDNNSSFLNNASDKEFEKIKNFHKYYVGFLSHNNSTINFRYILKDNKLARYDILTLNQNDSSKIYIKPIKINLLTKNINLVMTEGIFDLISIYENYFKDLDNSNTIFMSVNGKAYKSAIKYIMKLGFLDLNIEIFSDDDVDTSFYKKIKMYNPLLKNSRIKINYNTDKKDFGVPSYQIERIFNII